MAPKKKRKHTELPAQVPTPKQAPAKPQIVNKSANIHFEKFKVDRVKIIAGIVLVGFLCSFLYHYYQIHVLDKDYYPYNTFLFSQGDRFNDFNNQYLYSVHLNPYDYVGQGGYKGNYFPFTYLIFYLFNTFDIQIALFILLISFALFFIIYIYKHMPVSNGLYKNIAVLIFAFLSYPFLFVLDRANVEVWLFMSLAMFVFYYVKGKDVLALCFLSMAISLKLYPAVFLLLYFIDRKYMCILYTGIVTCILSVSSAAIFKGGIIHSFKGLIEGLAIFAKGNILSSSSSTIQHNTSIWAPFKLLYYNILIQMSTMPLHYEEKFNKYYVIFTICFFVLLTIIMVRYKMSFWKKITLLLLTSIVLQQSSFDYKLINIFIPLMLFLNSEEESHFNLIYAVIFGLLLIPKDYIILIDDISISVIINPVLIMIMIIMIIFEAIKENNRIIFSSYLSFDKSMLKIT